MWKNDVKWRDFCMYHKEGFPNIQGKNRSWERQDGKLGLFFLRVFLRIWKRYLWAKGAFLISAMGKRLVAGIYIGLGTTVRESDRSTRKATPSKPRITVPAVEWGLMKRKKIPPVVGSPRHPTPPPSLSPAGWGELGNT